MSWQQQPSGKSRRSPGFKKNKNFWRPNNRRPSLTKSCAGFENGKVSPQKDRRLNEFVKFLPDVENFLQEIIVQINASGWHNPSKCSKLQESINSLLDLCCQHCSIENIVSYVDNNGYDLLQLFVAHNLCEVVAHIFDLGLSVCILDRPCTSPVHLACRKGFAAILQIFLDRGADFNYKSSVCYPTAHAAVTPEDVDDDDDWSNKCCVSKKFSLIDIALMCDHAEIMQLLMVHPRTNELDKRQVLYQACLKNATKCLTPLLPLLPQQANARYGAHLEDSLLFVAFSKSIECGSALLQADVIWTEDTMLKTNSSGESLLHLIMRYNAGDKIFMLTKLAIEKCMFPKNQINCRDHHGNTPLLLLLRLIGRAVQLPSQLQWLEQDISYSDFVEKCQKEWNESVSDTFRYLINCGADVHAQNKLGETTVHSLLKDHYARRLYARDSSFYKQALPEVSRMLEYLIMHKVSVNSSSLQVASPLAWAVHILTSLEADVIDTTWPSFYYTFNILLQEGADPNGLDEKGIHLINILLTTVSRWLNQCVSESDLYRASLTLRHITTLLHRFFECGLNLPEDVLDLSVKQLMILCNVNIPSDLSEQAPMVLNDIAQMLVPFFLHGVDPHTLHLVQHGEDALEVPCKLQANFYLARAFIIHRKHQAMSHILNLLQSSLEQQHYNKLIVSICGILSSNFEDNSYRETSQCIQYIAKQKANARPLQVLCKVAISKHLDWKLRERVPMLQLPKALQRYLLYGYIPQVTLK